MRKLFLFVFATIAFVACTQNEVGEQVAVNQETPDTITVGFEGNDTRIQLNDALKTVWNTGDEVSVFYRSNGNQKWQYKGEDGVRQANLNRVQNATGNTSITKTIVVYPYDETYWLNTDSYCIEATAPATQHYAVDSYGIGDNLMVSQGEFTQFSLKNVYGWLKLQITGNNDVIKSIKFYGNNSEQVAGLIYVDTATAESTLAAEMGGTDDNNAGGNLVFEDTILTEVTLDCDEGVTLSSEATAFYIALPPQTFETGFTVEITDTDDCVMTVSSNNTLNIQRNVIQPMAAITYVKNVVSNKIEYTATAQIVVDENHPWTAETFGSEVVSHEFDAETGVGVITVSGEVTTIGDFAFAGCATMTGITIPDSITSIGSSAFTGCSELTSFIGKYAQDNGRILVIDGELVAFAPAQITEYTISNDVTAIGAGAFYNCPALQKVTIPATITAIGAAAFKDCSNLTSVICNATTIPAIGAEAFGGSFSSDRYINVPETALSYYTTHADWKTYKAYILKIADRSSYQIGDLVDHKGKAGVVFYASDVVVKLISVDMTKEKVEWGLYGTKVGATDTYNGRVNVDYVKASGYYSELPAFTWCSNLGVDWYLPAIRELIAVNKVLDQVTTTLAANEATELTKSYWSSSEGTKDYGYYYYFGFGYEVIDKTYALNVRAVVSI